MLNELRLLEGALAALVQLSRQIYVRAGREAVRAPGVPGAEALALSLGEGDRQRRATRLLRLLLERHGALPAGLANAGRRDQLKDFDPRATARSDALRALSWLGALLFFLDRSREVYMNDAAFRLGQILSAADTIHMGYCADRRGGDLPNALVGVSVLAGAGKQPIRALGMFQQRMAPYLAWSRRGSAIAGGQAGKRRIRRPVARRTAPDPARPGPAHARPLPGRSSPFPTSGCRPAPWRVVSPTGRRGGL